MKCGAQMWFALDRLREFESWLLTQLGPGGLGLCPRMPAERTPLGGVTPALSCFTEVPLTLSPHPSTLQALTIPLVIHGLAQGAPPQAFQGTVVYCECFYVPPGSLDRR